jgi:ketosteroid isomerase-like protein
VFVLACGGAQRPADDAAALDSTLRRYEQLVIAMDHASIAALFAPDGELGAAGQTPIRGPAAIDAYLAKFGDYKVLDEKIVATTTEIHGDTAQQRGTYHQRVRIPKGDVVEVGGDIGIDWVRTPEGWRIHKAWTKP